MRDMSVKTITILLSAFLLAGCTSSPLQFGAPGSSVPQHSGRSFSIEGHGEAQEAVRKALVEAGLQERPEGDFRIEVGFAVRPRDLSLSAPQEDAASVTLSPGTRHTIGFCKKQAYVLTIAVVERKSGRIMSRSGATLGRCSGNVERIMPQLARAAIPFKSWR